MKLQAAFTGLLLSERKLDINTHSGAGTALGVNGTAVISNDGLCLIETETVAGDTV